MFSKRTDKSSQKRGANIEYRHRPIADVQTHRTHSRSVAPPNIATPKTAKVFINDITPNTAPSSQTKFATNSLQPSKVIKTPNPVAQNHTHKILPKQLSLSKNSINVPPVNTVGKPKMFDIKPPTKNSMLAATQLNQLSSKTTHLTNKPNQTLSSSKSTVVPAASLPRRLDFTSPKPNKRKFKLRPHTNKLKDVPSLPLPNNNVFKRTINWLNKLSVKRKLAYALSAFAIVFLVIAATVNLGSLRNISNTQAGDSYSSTAGSDEADSQNSLYDEDQPTAQAVSRYTVAETAPKSIRIGSLGIIARTIRVGSDVKTGDIGMPKNTFDTGWYEASSRPGEDGAVLITGYSYGPNKPGIFENLKTITQGSTINITTGNGKQYSYKVLSQANANSKTIDISKLLKSQDPSKQGLNIMAYNAKNSKVSDEILIVYSVREN